MSDKQNQDLMENALSSVVEARHESDQLFTEALVSFGRVVGHLARKKMITACMAHMEAESQPMDAPLGGES